MLVHGAGVLAIYRFSALEAICRYLRCRPGDLQVQLDREEELQAAE